MASELTPWLLRLTLLSSLALLLVLAIRAPLRRFFGAAAAYQAWLLVPLTLAVACWPSRPAALTTVAPAIRSVRTLATQMVPAPSPQIDLLMLLWGAGALALAGGFMHSHRSFRRSAGALRFDGSVHHSSGAVGPASVGLFKPKIIVPHDYTQRYSAPEQMLVLAHEQVHIARRDALANLLQAALQCLFWFNPLVHRAALRFRQDQELSCDALVMAQHPRQRRHYAEALLKSHSTHGPRYGGIDCHWQTHHPTKERLMQLQSNSPNLARRAGARCLLALLAGGTIVATLAARAEQGSTALTYSVAMTIDADGRQSAPRILAHSGEQFAVASGSWRIDMTVRPAKTAGDVWVSSTVYKDAKIVSKPTLLAKLNGPAAIKLGSSVAPFAMTLVVAQQP